MHSLSHSFGLCFGVILGPSRFVLPLGALTFQLSRPRRQTALGRGGMMTTMVWSGQAPAAAAGRLERGFRHHPRVASSG